MVTTIINTAQTTAANANVTIADHATPASGTYVIYLRAETTTPERMENKQDSAFEGQGDISTSVSSGTIKFTQVFECWFDEANSKGTNWQNLTKALKYWAVENTFCYLTVDDSDGNNLAQLPNDVLTLEQIRGKLLAIDTLKWEANKRRVKFIFKREGYVL